MFYTSVARVVVGVSVYVWRRGNSLYATFMYGNKRKTVYFGR
jgi:hypothetical protein